MATIQPCTLIYDIEVRRHLARIDRKFHSLIREKIEQLLSDEPDRETRNRKPLSRPSALGTAWELRFGPDNRVRVFYRTNQELRQVYILAIGVKGRSRLVIGGQEFEL
jgi:mRNA-degrading endonuclease RelE of RelBE toxin-antitoxin system